MSAETTPKPLGQQRKYRVRSLVELCIETLVENIEEASAEVLECLPIPLLWRVYRHYACTRSQTISLWRVFSSKLVPELPRVPLSLYWFRWKSETRNAKQNDLPRLMQLSTSLSVDFITHLALHKVWMFRPSDLMALADMRNLGILELSDLLGQEQYEADREAGETTETVDSCLNDRLVRGWSEKHDPFPNLRVLVMTSVHSSVTYLTLQYAAHFPCLVYCILRSVALPNDPWQAEDLGWRMQRDLQPWKHRVLEGASTDKPWTADLPLSAYSAHDIVRQQLECFDVLAEGGVYLLSPSAAAAASPTPPETCESFPEDSLSLRKYNRFHKFRSSFDWHLWSLYSALGEQIGNADLVDQGVELGRRATHLAPSMGCQHSGIDESPHPGCGRAVLPPKPMLSVSLGRPGSFYDSLAGTWFRPGDYEGSLERSQGSRGHDYQCMKEHTFVRDYSRTMTETTGTGRTATKEAGAGRSNGQAGPSSKRKETAGRSTFKPRKRRDLTDILGYGGG